MGPLYIELPEESAYNWLRVDCNKCGICVPLCPMVFLRFGTRGYRIMRYGDDCWYCVICIFMCPRQAITVEDLA
jgi:NAD-dependent dihydropyrimidine dehydrogenase PreA subunit